MHGELQRAAGRTAAHRGDVLCRQPRRQRRGPARRHVGPAQAGLLANFSATFDPSSTGGFTDGKLGTGASANEALIFGGGCTGDKPDKAPKTDSGNDTKPTDQTTPQDRGGHKK